MEYVSGLFDLSAVIFTDTEGHIKCLLCGRWISGGEQHRARCPGELFTAPGALRWVARFEETGEPDFYRYFERLSEVAAFAVESYGAQLYSVDVEVNLSVFGSGVEPKTPLEVVQARVEAEENARRARAEETLAREQRTRQQRDCKSALQRLARERKDLVPEAYQRRLDRLKERYQAVLVDNPQLLPQGG